MSTKAGDPLDMTLRALLERMLSTREPSGGWINVRDDRWPWRQLVAAAERGEVSVSRVGRKLLMRTEDLDRWLTLHAIKPSARKSPANDVDESPVAHLLEDAGYRPRHPRLPRR